MSGPAGPWWWPGPGGGRDPGRLRRPRRPGRARAAGAARLRRRPNLQVEEQHRRVEKAKQQRRGPQPAVQQRPRQPPARHAGFRRFVGRAGRGADARPLHGGGDPDPQVAADLELLARQRPGHHAQVHLVDLEALHAQHRWRVKQQRPSDPRPRTRPRRPCGVPRWPAPRPPRSGSGTSTTARAQSRDRLVTCDDLAVRDHHHLAVRVRSRVVRSATSSIVPVAPS